MKFITNVGLGAIAAFAVASVGGVAFAGDAANGEKDFKKYCLACHNTPDQDKNKIGPSLHGVVGRHVAAYPGFAYSNALKEKDWAWDEAHLDTWLTKPSTMVPGTKMSFNGTQKPEERADLIAYLAANK